ncbi:hypothetical protein EGW08_017687, partial [Elysia chlorotica]
LPKQFLSSLRILFDILDENRTGFIRLQDIESRWSDDGVRGLPPGVVDGLRRVTPPNGFLSFDRFVAGLKLVLVKRKDSSSIDTRKPLSSKENQFAPSHSNEKAFLNQRPQPYSQSSDVNRQNNDRYQGNTINLAREEPGGNQYNPKQPRPGERTMNIAKRFDQQRHSSEPQELSGNIPSPIQHPSSPSYPPTVRESYTHLASQLNSPPAVPPRHTSSHVIADLKNWQAGWKGNGHGYQQSQQNLGGNRRGGSSSPTNRNPDNENTIYANVPMQQPGRLVNQQQSQTQALQAGPQRATVRRHGSGRRHTLSNGIDQNMLRRMKQLEEETSVLHAGMAMLDSARDWYKKQLAAVADKQAMLGKVSYNDNSVEAHQERMNFQRARIAEVNQHLQTLIDSSEKGFPLHMNLAMARGMKFGVAGIGNHGNQDAASSRELQSLREQNRQLQAEVGQRRDQLGQLEREKASLVRDLFETRAKNRPSHDDTTFM